MAIQHADLTGSVARAVCTSTGRPMCTNVSLHTWTLNAHMCILTLVGEVIATQTVFQCAARGPFCKTMTFVATAPRRGESIS
jgi:hypothetical protein